MRLGFRKMTLLMGVLALVAAGCGEDTPPADGGTPDGEETVCATADTDAGDLLAEICTNEEIRVSTDPAYPPQSELNADTGEYEGFDIDVATEIADRLGVEVAWETPDWEVLTAGSWNDRWDMSVGSMTPTNDRQEVLNFTEPYSFVPAVVVVPRGLGRLRRHHRPGRHEDRGLRGLHLPVLLGEEPRDLGLRVRFRDRRRDRPGLRHGHHGAPGSRTR